MLRFGHEYKLGDGKLHVIHIEFLLKALGLNQDEFRDLCILLRCDYNGYNGEVKGYPPDGKKYKNSVSIGMKRAWPMITEYRRLEEISKYLDDPAPLIYRRCRELFTIPDSVSVRMVPYNKPIKENKLLRLMKENNITISVEYIMKCCNPPKITFCDSETDDDI